MSRPCDLLPVDVDPSLALPVARAQDCLRKSRHSRKSVSGTTAGCVYKAEHWAVEQEGRVCGYVRARPQMSHGRRESGQGHVNQRERALQPSPAPCLQMSRGRLQPILVLQSRRWPLAAAARASLFLPVIISRGLLLTRARSTVCRPGRSVSSLSDT